MLDDSSGRVTYFGFDKFGSGKQARDAFQIKGKEHIDPNIPKDGSWSDARLRGQFDTLQLYENGTPRARVPREYGDTPGQPLEPFTKAYPEYGPGGKQQLHADGQTLEYDKVTVLPEK